MSKCRVTNRAKADLGEAWLYIAKDRPSAADRLLERIQRQFEMIAENPEFGEKQPDLAANVRLCVVGIYAILYRTTTGAPEIVRVIHGARNVAEEFRKHWPS